jgi:hypothetical protein
MERSKMITLTHNRATFTVKPEHAEPTRELLALIDKSKGRKGRKLPKDKGNPKHDSSKRYFPAFEPGMSTADYVARYAALNGHLHLAKMDYEHADRPAPELDPTVPEVVEEL